MREITLEQATDLLEIMTIEHSIEGGNCVTHHGHIEGQRTIIISTSRGIGACFLLQT
jgi:hypothetical protein